MSESLVRSPRMRSVLLWGGLLLAVFAGKAMAVWRDSGVLEGPAQAAVLAVIGLVGLLGLVGVYVALRRSEDWASNRETARLLEWLTAHGSHLHAAEACVAVAELRRTVEAQLDPPATEALFGGDGDINRARPGDWAERVRWDELFDALPRRGRRRPAV